MTVIICPGVHDMALSDRFLTALNQQLQKMGSPRLVSPEQVLPTQRHAPFDGLAVWSFVEKMADPQAPLVLVGFSAGVVGAIAAANLWQAQGGTVAAVIAVDGWGVPQVGDFPLHRVSHDGFTHWSSALLGAGADGFYADPPVAHLDLWQFPERAWGYRVKSSGAAVARRSPTCAIAFISDLIKRYRGAHQPQS